MFRMDRAYPFRPHLPAGRRFRRRVGSPGPLSGGGTYSGCSKACPVPRAARAPAAGGGRPGAFPPPVGNRGPRPSPGKTPPDDAAARPRAAARRAGKSVVDFCAVMRQSDTVTWATSHPVG